MSPLRAELCSLITPDDLQGQSLVPMLLDPATVGKDAVYTVVTRGDRLGKAIRTNRWRYAIWPDGEELYDLENDLAEHTNLAASEQHAAILAAMRTRLAKAESRAAAARQPRPKPAIKP